MPTHTENTQGDITPRIRRARVDSFCIYDVTEDELSALEQGLPGSLNLNFSIALLSCALSYTSTLFTVNIENVKLFSIFIIITVIGYIMGIYLFIAWRREYKSTKSIISKIRNRLKEECDIDNLAKGNPDPTSTIGPTPLQSSGVHE